VKNVLVEYGKPRSVIVVGKNATPLEKHAAQELQKYVRRISGASLPIMDSGKVSRMRNQILIGRPETNEIVKGLCDEGKIKLSKDHPGLDGFIIATARGTSKTYLVIGGSMDRGTLYAVYHLLENFLGVGFFWDGEHVPKQRTIELEDMHVSERPYFPIRQCVQGCAFCYNWMYWGWEEGKREVDWMAKKKFNRRMFPFGSEGWTHTIPENPTPYEKFEMERSKRVVDYARSLGIEHIIAGGIPSQEFLEYYGTDHVYDHFDLWGERKVGETPEEEKEIFIKGAKEGMAKMKAFDPEGVWHVSGWTFYAGERYPETVKAFCDAIDPADSCYICDIYAEKEPIYKIHNYLYGKTWGFGVLHSFGGDAYLHGNMAGLLRRAKEVANDPRAKNCKIFSLNPEMSFYNTLYFELAAELSWNPKQVELGAFLRKYSTRRYGKESAPSMVKSLKELSKDVYGTRGGNKPVYWNRLAPSDEGHSSWLDFLGSRHKPAYWDQPTPVRSNLYMLREGNVLVPQLHKALANALLEKEKQRGNSLYGNDLGDICRQYIGEVFKFHHMKLNNAFRHKNKEEFEKQAAILSLLMDSLEKVTHSRKDYHIELTLEKIGASPGATPQVVKRAERRIKGWIILPLAYHQDYPCKDVCETVRLYYHPRVETYIKFLRNKLKEGITTVNCEEELAPLYDKIETPWLEKPLPKERQAPSRGQAETVAKVFKSLEEAYRQSIPAPVPHEFLTEKKEWRKIGNVSRRGDVIILESGAEVTHEKPQLYGTFECELKVDSMDKMAMWGFIESDVQRAVFLVHEGKLKMFVKESRLVQTWRYVTNDELAVDATKYHHYKVVWGPEAVQGFVDGNLFASVDNTNRRYYHHSPTLPLAASVRNGDWLSEGTGNRIHVKGMKAGR